MTERVRFYADEHIPPTVIEEIRRRGGDITTVKDAGLRGAADEVHFIHAVAARRAILTQDTDFLQLHASGRPHPGIIYATMHLSVSEIIAGVWQIHEQLTPAEMANRVKFL